ncbi:hypothetical protein [Aquibacillus albus]|uniref:PIN domain-containing protein n=1 Tax=Aquibacillus albus TaxID=1168171 RepID=A0ABS2N4A5_9BACI|nr:hypothetical protein [Aquibacillus albus]MBM7572929.1 hypothetical protein [Aquibacillus albus]
MGRSGKVFIDANIINLAVVYKREDVLGWINNLYDKIYIHISVMNELITNKSYAEEQIENGNWILFDPDDENCLSNEQFTIYEHYIQNVRDGFRRLNEKKKKQGREIKNTSNIGEIDSLAAAILLSANIICSNDYEIREVIEDEEFSVAVSEEEVPELIVQDTIEDFCVFCVQYGIASKKEVRKFFKVVYTEDEDYKRQRKLNSLNNRLDTLN